MVSWPSNPALCFCPNALSRLALTAGAALVRVAGREPEQLASTCRRLHQLADDSVPDPWIVGRGVDRADPGILDSGHGCRIGVADLALGCVEALLSLAA